MRVHESTVRLLVALLRAFSKFTEPGDSRISPDARSYVMQALDNAADPDLLFGVLADELAAASRKDPPIAGAG